MKKMRYSCLIFLSAAVLITSCSQSSALHYSFSETDTIRYEAVNKTASIEWTGLQDTASTVNSARDTEKRRDTFSEQLALSFGPKTTMVYPALKGFGSLDTRDITPEIRKGLTAFLTALSSGTIPQDFFDSDYRFAAVVAQYQMNLMEISFTDYAIGKPYIAHNDESPLYEIPVLAEGSGKSWIITIYLHPQGALKNRFLVQQLNLEVQPEEQTDE